MSSPKATNDVVVVHPHARVGKLRREVKNVLCVSKPCLTFFRVIVKRKLNKGPKLEKLDGDGQDKREGRHLLFMQGSCLLLTVSC